MENTTQIKPILLKDLGTDPNKSYQHYGLFKCNDCDDTFIREIRNKNLRCNKCINISFKTISKTHGEIKTKIYQRWAGMKNRCYNTSKKDYHKYKDKGIIVCNEWKHNYLAFKKWALSNGYKDGLTLDRIDGDKNYTPENCRWTNYCVQAQNVGISKTNKSGFTGVHKTKYGWTATIQADKKRLNIGTFKCRRAAVYKRDRHIIENELYHRVIFIKPF